MPVIGIWKSAGNLHITEPGTAKGHTATVSQEFLDMVYEDMDAQAAQDALRKTYDSSRPKMSIWQLIRTENPFWHVQAVISILTMTFAVLFSVTALANNAVGVSDFIVFFGGATGASSFSLYTLIRRKRYLKRISSLILFMMYDYFMIYFLIQGMSWIPFLITGTFALLSALLYIEWGKPSKIKNL